MCRALPSIALLIVLSLARNAQAYESCKECRTDHASICSDECESLQYGKTKDRGCPEKCLVDKCRRDCTKTAAKPTPNPKSTAAPA